MDDKSLIMQKPDYLICTCMGVMYSEIIESIKSGQNTFEMLSDSLMVGTGCNSCVSEIEEILCSELKNK